MSPTLTRKASHAPGSPEMHEAVIVAIQIEAPMIRQPMVRKPSSLWK